MGGGQKHSTLQPFSLSYHSPRGEVNTSGFLLLRIFAANSQCKRVSDGFGSWMWVGEKASRWSPTVACFGIGGPPLQSHSIHSPLFVPCDGFGPEGRLHRMKILSQNPRMGIGWVTWVLMSNCMHAKPLQMGFSLCSAMQKISNATRHLFLIVSRVCSFSTPWCQSKGE